MLRDDVNKIFDSLSRHHVSDEKQKELLLNGLYFDYTYGDPDYNRENRKLNFFEIGRLIDYLEGIGIPFDINEIINTPYTFRYPELVRMIADNKNDDVVVIKIKK